MAMKTVICLSFIVLNNFFANMCQSRYLEGERGRRPPKQNSPSPKLPSISTQTFVTPAAVSRWCLVCFGNQPRPRRKVDHIGAMNFLFWISTKNLEKTRPTQKFWLLQKQILPLLELRSSCGIDMCVKKNCASPTRSLTARHCC